MRKNQYVFLLFCSFVFFVLFSFPAFATNSEIKEAKEKISVEKQKLAEVNQKKKELEGKLAELEQLKGNAAEYISSLDTELALLEEENRLLEQELQLAEDDIRRENGELEKANAEEAEMYASMKERIRLMYENSGETALELLLSSGSLAELLSRSEYVESINAYDRQKLDEYAVLKEGITQRIADLEEKKSVLQIQQQDLKDRTETLTQMQESKRQEMADYEKRIEEANTGINDIKGDIKSIQAAIQAEENMIAAIEAEARRREEEARLAALARGEKYEPMTVGNISFTWPCPGQDRITSAFGSRERPTAGASTEHKGIDIGAPSGEAVVAAAGGTVVISQYSASAGNYIMISHGADVYTVYMHLTKRSVDVGDTVSRGTGIGTVGSTGYSTGPHLHFGIRISGNYVNPLAYVTP